MSTAIQKRSRGVSVNRPSRSSAAAKATEWTSRSSPPPNASAGLGEDPVEVVVGADVALRHELRVDGRCEVAHRLLDALALVRERELRALGGEPLGDRPGDGALVGDPQHERLLSLEPPRHRGDPTRLELASGRNARLRARRVHVSAPRGAPLPARQVPDGARGGGTASPGSTSTTPRPPAGTTLRRTHSTDWVERVRDGRLERREELALGLPWSAELVERARRATGATILAARAALADGVADEPRRRHAPRVRRRRARVLRLQRRRHRAARAPGRGAASPACSSSTWTSTRETARTRSSPGTRRRSRCRVNGFRNYPFRRVPGDLDVELPDGTGRRPVSRRAGARCSRARSAARGPSSASSSPAPTRSRATGSGGSLSRRKASQRATRFVRDTLDAAGVPICLTLAGGYAEDIRDTVEINVNTLRVFA